MQTFTLDTNCIIDVAEDRPAAEHIRELLIAHSSGIARVALVASSASERQIDGAFLRSFGLFNDRRSALGFGHLPVLPPIGRFDVSFIDHCLSAGEASLAREAEIFRCMFPSSEPEWSDYASARGLNPTDRLSTGYLRWRNQMLDAQAFWAHEHHGQRVFVTSDRRFRIFNGHPLFPEASVCDPEEAAKLVQLH